jgi:hypothetical protein
MLLKTSFENMNIPMNFLLKRDGEEPSVEDTGTLGRADSKGTDEAIVCLFVCLLSSSVVLVVLVVVVVVVVVVPLSRLMFNA